MAILPEVVIPAAEISREDVRVGDPEVPPSSDQEKLRKLICANRHLLIGKVIPHPLRLVEQSVILMSETLTRSHKGYDLSHPCLAKSWLI